MIRTVLTFLNGIVEVRLIPETQEDVSLLDLASRGRVPLILKDGGEDSSKILILQKKDEAMK